MESEQRQLLLQIRGISKNFTGTLALDKVDLDIYKGEVHALLGENGAGKSTLIKILSGVYPCSQGSLTYRGEDIGLDVKRLLLSVIHQDLGLVNEMSVAENIALTTGYPRSKTGMISWNRTAKQASELLNRMNSNIDPSYSVQILTAAEKSIVAISRALAQKVDILILDEPTATLPQNDVEELFKVIQTLRDEGIAIIYVTHRLDEVFQIANRVTVLRNGCLITTNKVEETNPEQLVKDIVGSEIEKVKIADNVKPSDECMLSVKNMLTSFVGPVSFELNRGEIVALFGLRGAGHHEVGRCIWGLEKLDGGSISLYGKNIRISSPQVAIRNKIGFVSSKRHEEGIAPSFSVRENIYINPIAKDGKILRLMDIKEERKQCQKAIERFSIRPSDSERTIGTLSGGNQQKAVVARWFEVGSDLMIFEEPTIGVDVGAKAEIYQLIIESLNKGKAVLLISSDFEEVSLLSHRAIVFRKGRVVGVVDRSEMSSNLLNGLALSSISRKDKGVEDGVV